MNIQVRTILLGLLSIGFVQSYAQTFALQVKNDQITYLNDDRGNRILDFSTCGYKSSEQDIPSVRNVVFVPDRKSTRLNSSHNREARMPSSA